MSAPTLERKPGPSRVFPVMELSLQEPCCRGTTVHAFRCAALEMWGQLGWSELVALLPPETRSAVIDRQVVPVGWVPERYIMDLGEAVFAGPAEQLEAAYRKF